MLFTMPSLAQFLPILIPPLLFSLYLYKSTSPPTNAYCENFDYGFNISLVAFVGRNLASHSWEYGTAAEALLELSNPELSVFGPNPFPTGKLPLILKLPDVPSLAWARPFIWLGRDRLCEGDGSTTDPASLGVSALLLGQSDPAYRRVADAEAHTLLSEVPRFWNGAISHRDSHAEVWGTLSIWFLPFSHIMASRRGKR